jgi:hypothetical protein
LIEILEEEVEEAKEVKEAKEVEEFLALGSPSHPSTAKVRRYQGQSSNLSLAALKNEKVSD